MITKSRIVGLLTILVVGFLVLRPGDEPSESGDRNGDSGSATDRQLQPREPAFPRPSRDYGITSQPSPGHAPAPYGKREPLRQQPYPQIGSRGYGAPAPYGQHARITPDGYRFRPLNEREQERMRARYPDQYPYADQYPGQTATRYDPPAQTYPSYEAQPRSPAPYSAPYSPPDAYSDPRRESYSFRPLEKSPGARGRWQGPYQEPGRRYDRYPMEPWTAPSDPQWGSTPPAQRMYPNLYRNPGRRLTAR